LQENVNVWNSGTLWLCWLCCQRESRIRI
jgi:hypothetical protein